MSDIKKKDPTITKSILETLDDSIMELCYPYTKLKRLELFGFLTKKSFNSKNSPPTVPTSKDRAADKYRIAFTWLDAIVKIIASSAFVPVVKFS